METLWQQLLAGRPGILGQPWFYLALITVYGVAVVWLIFQAIRIAHHPENDKVWRWVVPLVLVTLLRGGVYSVLNPPWYSPDEPSHFEYARLLHDLGRVPKKADVSTALQGEMIASMYQFDFWRLNGMQVPEQVPIAFRSGLSVNMQAVPRTYVIDNEFLWYYPQIGNEPSTYYYLLQPAFWFNRGNVLLQFYQARWVTVVLYAGCVFVTFWITRYLLGELPGGAIAVTAWMALHPMMGYMGSSVNNDILGALSALLAFALIGMISMKGWTRSRGLALAFVLILAIFSKKTTLFLIPTCVLAGLLHLWQQRKMRHWVYVVLGLISLGLLGSVASAWIPIGTYANAWISRPDPLTKVRHADCAYEGAYGFVLPEVNAGEFRLAQSLVNAVGNLAGKSLIVEAMVRSTTGTVELVLVDDVGRHVAAASAETDWQLVRLMYMLPSTATSLRLNVTTKAADASGQRICVDAIRLYTVDRPNANYVCNGSAEEAASLFRTGLLSVAYPLQFDEYLLPWFMERKTEDWRTLLPLSVRFVYNSFWGIFGSLSLAAPQVWYDIFSYGTIIAMLGLLGFYIFRAPHAERTLVEYSVLLLGGVLLNWMQIFLPLFNRPNPGWLPQGRFLFPASAPMLGLLYLGVSAWLPKWLRPWLAPFLMVVMVGMDSWILITMVRYSYLG